MNAFKKWWVKLLLVFAAVIVMFAVWLAMSGAHSKNAVERYKDQLRAGGEKFDLKDVIPPPVDPDRNGLEFFMRAVNAMHATAGGIVATNRGGVMRIVAPGKATVGWQQAIIFDPDFSTTNTWEELDQELQRDRTALDLFRQCSERPQLDFELEYSRGENIPLSHLGGMKQVAYLLSAATVADLHRGDSALATTNLHAFLGLINQWKDEPIFISQLIRNAMAHIAVPTQWEFLQATNLTDEELALLQRDWTDAQFIRPMESALSMERARETQFIEQLRSSNSPSGVFAGAYTGLPGSPSASGSGSGDWLDVFRDIRDSVKHRASDTLWRVSWSYDDELSLLQGDQVLLETGRQIRTNGNFKGALADRDRKLAALGLNRPGTNWLRNHLDDVLASFLGAENVQSIARSWERVLNTEVARDVAVAAIAVKRYQLRHGTAPPDLNALVPEFLPAVPRDPVDGKPLRYKFNPDGTFLLYSIGIDGVDDGGDPSPPAGAKSIQWQRGKDWVWPQAVP